MVRLFAFALNWLSVAAAVVAVNLAAHRSPAAEVDLEVLQQQFSQTIQPLLQAHCYDCHGSELQEAKLNLSEYSSPAAVAKGYQTWDIVTQRLQAEEMPPEDAPTQLKPGERQAIVAWIRAVRDYEAERTAGDPGEVLARRLSNAEYNYTIRDLTGVDIRPTREFPVDPANEAGFDNTGESLAMSPALLQKYLGAARQVVEHLVLLPEGFTFAAHPAQTNTDRDKFCVARIIAFYERQPTDYADYFHAAWRYQHREKLGLASADLEKIAAAERVSPK